jgi:uncharacterized protein YxeA
LDKKNKYVNLYRFFRTSIFWVLIHSFCFIQHGVAQEKSVYGKVEDPESGKGIASINIQNKRTGQIVVTNDLGEFYLRAIKGDSIFISTFGYDRKGIKYDAINKNPIIYAVQQATMLQELVVIDKKNSELKREIEYFLNNPTDAKAIRNEILKSMINTQTSRPMSIGISIDALYDMYSKEGKSKRKVADLQYNDVKKFYADLKYNKQIVSQITKLQEEEIEEFMNFCKPTEDFILRSSDYELTFKILKCLGEFRSSRIYRKIR